MQYASAEIPPLDPIQSLSGGPRFPSEAVRKGNNHPFAVDNRLVASPGSCEIRRQSHPLRPHENYMNTNLAPRRGLSKRQELPRDYWSSSTLGHSQRCCPDSWRATDYLG